MSEEVEIKEVEEVQEVIENKKEPVPYERYSSHTKRLNDKIEKLKSEQTEYVKELERLKSMETSFNEFNSNYESTKARLEEIEGKYNKLNEWQGKVLESKLSTLDENLQSLIPQNMSNDEKIEFIDKLVAATGNISKPRQVASLSPTSQPHQDVDMERAMKDPKYYSKVREQFINTAFKK